MKVYVGADHNGYHLRQELIEYLRRAGYQVVDEGDERLDPADDFPIFAQRLIADMRASDDEDPRGILICGSGQGMCIAANRFRGIRACLGYNRDTVRSARNDDDCNVLCLPADTIQKGEAQVITEAFLNIAFANASRFIRRRQQLDEIGG